MSKSLFETHIEKWEGGKEVTMTGIIKTALYYAITHPLSVLGGIFEWIITNPFKFILLSSFITSFFDTPSELLINALSGGISPETLIPNQTQPNLEAR